MQSSSGSADESASPSERRLTVSASAGSAEEVVSVGPMPPAVRALHLHQQQQQQTQLQQQASGPLTPRRQPSAATLGASAASSVSSLALRDPVARGDVAEVRRLLADPVHSPAALYHRGQFGDSLLHHVRHGVIAKILIEAGLDLEAADNEGYTPLMVASSDISLVEVCVALVEAGARIKPVIAAGGVSDTVAMLEELQNRLVAAAVASGNAKSVKSLAKNPECHAELVNALGNNVEVTANMLSGPDARDAIAAFRLLMITDASEGETVRQMADLRLLRPVVTAIVRSSNQSSSLTCQALLVLLRDVLSQSHLAKRDMWADLAEVSLMPLVVVLVENWSRATTVHSPVTSNLNSENDLPEFGDRTGLKRNGSVDSSLNERAQTSGSSSPQSLPARTPRLSSPPTERSFGSGMSRSFSPPARFLQSGSVLSPMLTSHEQKTYAVSVRLLSEILGDVSAYSIAKRAMGRPEILSMFVSLLECRTGCLVEMGHVAKCLANICEQEQCTTMLMSLAGIAETVHRVGVFAFNAGCLPLFDDLVRMMVQCGAWSVVEKLTSTVMPRPRTSSKISSLASPGHDAVGSFPPISATPPVLLSSNGSTPPVINVAAAAAPTVKQHNFFQSGMQEVEQLNDAALATRGLSLVEIVGIITSSRDNAFASLLTPTRIPVALQNETSSFADCILRTHSTFVDSVVLFRLLRYRFGAIEPQHQARGPSEVQRKVVRLYLNWVDMFRTDFHTIVTLESELRSFLQDVLLPAGGDYAVWAKGIQYKLMEAKLQQPISYEVIPTECEHDRLYVLLRDAFMDESLACNEASAVQLTALQIRIEQLQPRRLTGTLSGGMLKRVSDSALSTTQEIKFKLPNCHRKSKTAVKGVLQALEQNAELSEADSKHKFILLCQRLPTHKCDRFDVRDISGTSKSPKTPLCLCMNHNTLLLMDTQTKEVLEEIKMIDLRAWSSMDAGASLLLETKDQGTKLLETDKAMLIEDTLKERVRAVTSHAYADTEDFFAQSHGPPPFPEICPCPPMPLLTADCNLNALALLDLLNNVEETARQMTLIEHELYLRIVANDCLGRLLKVKKRVNGVEQPSPLDVHIQRFNLVSSWVMTEVMRGGATREERSFIIERFILIAKKCAELQNFNGVLEIVSGLNSSSVLRLKQTWELVGKMEMGHFETLVKMFSAEGNYRAYRSMMHSISPPAVPYFGMFLKDLTFTMDGNPDFVIGGRINTKKSRQLAAVLRTIQYFQSLPYNLRVVPQLREFLLKIDALDENELHDRSKALE